MVLASRHQCLIYQGPPSCHLASIASVVQQKLQQQHRCLYLNSMPMVAGIKSYLAAKGVDVAGETTRGSLMLSSDQNHLLGGRRFDVDLMMDTLANGLQQALHDGYEGLWASGDMTWEFGPERDFSKLLEYEWRLEEFLRQNPQMSGICLYHGDSMPHDVLHNGLLTHQSVFINETLSCINPHFLPAESHHLRPSGAKLDSAIHQLFEHKSLN
jgi:MEDS: MEthanogen/methylotroph, DcmR Sensory domain